MKHEAFTINQKNRRVIRKAKARAVWTQQQPVIQRMKLDRDEVKAMYSHGNLRDRALLLVLAQSGFSEVDVSCLRIEELKGLYENPETEHYFIEKPREKNKWNTGYLSKLWGNARP